MWEFLIKKIRFSLILIFSIAILGAFALSVLPIEAMPEVKIPYASVVTIYSGASPLDVEELITNKIEDGLESLENVKTISSSSVENASMIFIEFEAGADIEDCVRKAQDAVTKVTPQLPDDAEDPVVSELNYSNTPIFTLSLSAEMSHTELVEIAEDLKSEIMGIQYVSDVQLVGVRDKQILIEFDAAKLSQYNVSLMEVYAALASAESSMPLGSIEVSDKEYNLRFTSKLAPQDVANLIIRGGASNIYLRDIAEVSYGLTEISRYARLSIEGGVPEDAISMNVYKKTGGDVTRMADQIYALTDQLEVDTGVSALYTVDYAEDIRDQLGSLVNNGIETMLLVGLVLFLSLGIREAFVAGLSIPLTFLISFIGIYVYGGTLNFLSLFALILALGILVDTGIVITEGMHVKLKEGKDPKTVALETVREYELPLISGTMTTVAAFVPMLMMTGIIGEFVKHIPKTVILTLLASLFVGLGILPVIGARILRRDGKTKVSILEGFIQRKKAIYRSILDWVCSSRKRQNRLIGTMVFLFFLASALPISGILEATMFPSQDYRYYYIEIELPKGSSLDETNIAAEQVEQMLIDTPEVESFVTTVGSSSGLAEGGLTTGNGSDNLANFIVNLREDRERNSMEITRAQRELVAKIPNAKINVMDMSDGPPSASAIDFRIIGPDLDELKKYSDEAISMLENIDGAINIASSLEDTLNEFVLSVDRQKAAAVGLDPSSLAQVARLAIAGMQVTTLKDAGDDVEVYMQVSDDMGIDEVLALPILTQKGTFAFSNFVDVSFEPAPTVVSHVDGDRVASISGDVEPGYNATEILAQFQAEFVIDDGEYYAEYGGELEEMVDSFTSLGYSMLVGVLLIIVILILQFNSFRQAGMIVFTIPLALIGVFFGLTIGGYSFSFPAFVGIVALAGIVVNNAIILIDKINRNIEAGMNKKDAILDAAVARFQPILLTSITTVVGIAPLAISDPTWGPLGFTIISGLVFSTVLTLFVVPALYMRFER